MQPESLRNRIQHLLGDLGIGCQVLRARGGGLIAQKVGQAREDIALQDRQFVVAVFGQTFFFGAFDRQRTHLRGLHDVVAAWLGLAAPGKIGRAHV